MVAEFKYPLQLHQVYPLEVHHAPEQAPEPAPIDPVPKAADTLVSVAEQSGQRRLGIMSVRLQRESVNLSKHRLLTAQSRIRRAQRLQKDAIQDDQCVVRFGTVEIREFPTIFGDNPGSRSGPPLSIDWEPTSAEILDVDEYEKNRPEGRMYSEMRIPPKVRLEILKKVGYSRKEIVELGKPVNILRLQRKRTIETRQLHFVEEAAEVVYRRTLNILSMGRRKENERKFLEPFSAVTLKESWDESWDSATVRSEDLCEL
jgi:hypothetical protein